MKPETKNLIKNISKNPIAAARFLIEMAPLYTKMTYYNFMMGDIAAAFKSERISTLPDPKYIKAQEKIFFDMEKAAAKYACRTKSNSLERIIE